MDLFKKAIEDNDVDLLVGTRQSKNVNKVEQERLSFGEKIADKVTAFNGSWLFIIIYILIILLWCGLNVGFLFFVFDPYPFVFLNLVLAIITAIQAPFIMMSQNRQSKKDTIMAELDYKLNLKGEIIHEEIIKRLNRVEENQQVLLGNQIKILSKLESPPCKKNNKDK